MQLEPCDQNPYLDKIESELDRIFLSNGYCIKDKDKMIIKGGSQSADAQILEVRVKKCK